MRSAIVVSLLGACSPHVDFAPDEVDAISGLSPVPRPPSDPTNAWADDPNAARLGQALFFSTALSSSGDVSCATCHDPSLGFGDAQRLSTGLGTTARHAPPLFNNAHQRWWGWAGAADSPWAQALGPIEDPDEMGSTRVGLVHVVVADPALRDDYEGLFGPLPSAEGLPERARPIPDDPDHPEALAWASLSEDTRDGVDTMFANLGKAIAAYERLLVSEDAPFDAFVAALVAGESVTEEHLDAAAQRGLRLFLGDAGCIGCHSGPLLTDHAFHNIGLAPRDWLDGEDQGRWDGAEVVLDDPFNGAGEHSDAPEEGAVALDTLYVGEDSRGAFKTPSLREVARTAPYMHGGHFERLEEVLDHYDRLEESPAHGHTEETLQPLHLSVGERADLLAFLGALSGAPLDTALLGAP